MTRDQFLNGVRVLWNIDEHELVEAGVIDPNDNGAWGDFHSNPHRWAAKASDETMDKLWALMCERSHSLVAPAATSWSDPAAGQAQLAEDNDGEHWQTLDLQHRRVTSIANPPKPTKYLYDLVVCGGPIGQPDKGQDQTYWGMSRHSLLAIIGAIERLVAIDDAALSASERGSQ